MRFFVLFTFLVAASLGCQKTEEAASQSAEPSATSSTELETSSDVGSDGVAIASWEASPVGAEIDPDPEIAALIQPYMESMHATMDETIGTASAEITRARPESPLGNLIADALLWFAKKEDESVQVSLINNGGIRLPSLPQGPISVGDVYQLAPFDNRIVIVTLSGDQIRSLLERLSERGGEPMAGITYRMIGQDNRVADVQIGNQPIDSDQNYKLATVDYLASIGDEFEILGEASERKDGTTLLRDAVVQYVRSKETVEPLTDGRVSHEDE